uniref:Uncharacterized protein n=1 Tax=Anguilla anguilla TaxID=7936 RepID=A0A0E9X4V3_ANGAN
MYKTPLQIISVKYIEIKATATRLQTNRKIFWNLSKTQMGKSNILEVLKLLVPTLPLAVL